MSSHHPFRILSEKGIYGAEEMEPLYAPDVIFHSPFLTKPVIGKGPAIRIVAEAFSHVGPPHYTLEITNDRQTVLVWNGIIKGYELQGAIVIMENTEGLISDMSILMRPYPVVSLFWEAMQNLAYALLPKEFWELPPLTENITPNT